MAGLHRYFICRTCSRFITGCRESCPAPDHKVEEVDNCVYCSKKEKEHA